MGKGRATSAGVLARFAILTLLLAPAFGAQGEVLTRGPYLQNVSTTAATLRWRTDVTSDSLVWLGTQPDNLSLFASASELNRNHQVRLTGLDPGSRYYYAIGSSAAQLTMGADHYFETAPIGAKPTRIWVMGDSGTGTPSQLEVRNAYYAHVGAAQTDLILMLGDNAYERGTDLEYQLMLFDVYGSILRHTPLWPTLGNHDGFTASSSSQTGPYYDIFTLPRAGEAGGVASGTEAYYSYDFGNIHFVCLNSYDVSRAADGPMVTWLRSDLAANSRDWTIAYFHHPPYSKGSHDSDTESYMVEMRTNVLPVLEQYGVDLVLAGHSHSYERSRLINGHYGPSSTLTPAMILDGGSGREGDTGPYVKPALGPVPNAGTVYAVVGVSGEFKTGMLLNHPIMHTSLGVLGSMVIDVHGNRLDATQLDNTGATVDSFSILKNVDPGPNEPPTVSIAAPAEGASYDAPAEIIIIAGASDGDGAVVRVDFYAGSTLLGTDLTEPFEHRWLSAPPGTHTLTVVARDDDGAMRSSAPLQVTVSGTPPTTTLSMQQGSGYAGMTDASLRSDQSSKNFGNAVTLLADGNPDQSAVFRWDLSAIPTTATVTKAELRLVVSDNSNAAFSFYALKRPFVETKVTWRLAATGVSWQRAGVEGSDDRETVVLGTLVPSTTGTHTIVLNAAGLAKLRSWVSDPATNHGLVLLNYTPSNGLKIHSSEAATIAVRPMLVVTYQ